MVIPENASVEFNSSTPQAWPEADMQGDTIFFDIDE